MEAFRAMLRRDLERLGFTVGQVAWRLGISPREYRELEDGDGFPDSYTWEAMGKLFGWPRSFAAHR